MVRTMEGAQLHAVTEALIATGGRRDHAAALLQINYRTMLRWCERLRELSMFPVIR